MTVQIDSEAERIALRWAQYEAEYRVNFLRAMAISVFYLVHFGHFLAGRPPFTFLAKLGLADGEVPNDPTHLAITFLTVAWLAAAWGLHLFLQNKYFPRQIMFIATALDLLMLTSVLAVVKGPSSPLVAAYFVILVTSALRLDLAFIRIATVMTCLAYVFLLGCAKWQMPLTKLNTIMTVPRYHQIIFLVALIITGITLGQIVRLARGVQARLVEDKGKA